MQQTLITTNKASISLTYNLFDSSQIGGNVINVSLIDLGDEPNTEWSVTVVSEVFFDITPQFFIIESFLGKNVTINVNNLIDLTPGNYTFSLVINNSNASPLSVPIYLSVLNENNLPPVDPVKEYKLKYYIDRENYKLDIFEKVNESDVLIPTEINGTIEFNYQDRKDLFEPIIASNLKLNLEASKDLSFIDLYSEEEQQFKVILTHNNETRFIGFLKPDGIYEDWVSDKWKLDISVIDGLSTLKNLYFSNENGTSVLSKMSILDVINICLNKTGLILPLNICVKVFYENFDGFHDILENVKINTERFLNDGEPMDCESVLSSILNIFNATLIMHNGEWFITRNIDLQEETIYSHYENGVFIGNITYEPIKLIGSQINGIENIDAFHINENQRKSIDPSVQAYRVYYEYGGAKSIFQNPELKLEGSGLYIPGWTVHTYPDGKVYRNESGFGLKSTTWWFDLNNIPVLLSLNQSVYINQGAIFNLSINFSNEAKNPLSTFGLRFTLQIGDHYLRDDGSWSVGIATNVYVNNSTGVIFDPPNSVFEGKGYANYSAQIKAPTSGNLNIFVFRDTDPNHVNAGASGGDFRILSINLTGTADGDVKGRVYTGRRTKKISSVTKSNKTVYNGDSVSDLFVGTLYKSDFETATHFWYREGKAESKELLSINAEDNLRISPRPMIVFEGDLYNYIPYLSVVKISGFEDRLFQFTAYSYDFNRNIVRAKFKEFSNEYLSDADFTVEVRDNLGDINNAKI